MRWLAVLGLGACAGQGSLVPAHSDGESPTDTPRGPDDSTPPFVETADTGLSPTGAPTTLSASCSLADDNTLRAWCTVTVDPPQPVEVAFAKADGTGLERVHDGPDALSEHRVGLYFMAPRTDYAFTVRAPEAWNQPEVTGVVTTESPPEGARVEYQVTGTSSAAMVGLTTPCTGSYVVVAGTDGEPLWYHQFQTAGPISGVEGVQFTEDGTVLALTGGSIIEVDLMGAERLRIVQGMHFTQALHHDTFRRDGLTYALFNEVVNHLGENFTLDGVYVFDDTGTLVGEWHLYDHFQPQSFEAPWGSADYSHANAVWADDSGHLYVSFRHLSGFVKLDGDLASPQFGDIEWRLSGNTAEDPDLGTDFTLGTTVGGTADFQQQHNVHQLPDGRFTMFDNRIGLQVLSRLIQLEVDEVSDTAEIVGTYTLPVHCDFQGGAWHTDAGNPMATCAPYREAYEFEDGAAGDPIWTMTASCPSGGFQVFIPRFTPLDW